MRLFLAILLIISSPVWARSEVEPDILVQSRFNRDWSSIFLNHMRAVMVSNGFGDPYKKTIEEPLIFDLGPQVSSLTPQSDDWYQALLKFLKIDLVKSDFKLIIEKFRYQVDNLDAAISPSTVNGRMNWVMSHNVDGLGLGSDKMSLEVQLYSTTGKPIVFSIQLVEPELIFNDMTLPVQAVWSSQILDESISVALTKLDLRDAMRGLQKNPNKVTMNFSDVIVPPVEIRIGERTVRIDPKKLRNWILSRKDEMKKFILDVIVLKNIDRFEDLTGDDDPTIPMERTFFAAGEKLSGAIKIDALVATQTQVRARMKSVFCNPREATDLKSCLETAPVNPRADRLGRDYEASLKKIYEELERNDANIVVSLSEPYLNQALTAAISSGILAEAFGDGEVSLAEGGALLRLDKSGDIFYAYLHLNNKLSGWDRRLTGRSLITFPIKLGIRLKLEQKDDQPTLMVDVVETEASEEMLLKGKPEIGMKSTIATVPRFRGKVVQKVQESVKKFLGQRLIELPMPFLKSTFLEKTQFVSDGLGRANALFKVEEKRRMP